ncbi:hypothetical protein Hdeb2414_s0010g00331391 [Helianthus debilis subsp. tardiflorus]
MSPPSLENRTVAETHYFTCLSSCGSKTYQINSVLGDFSIHATVLPSSSSLFRLRQLF